LPYTSIIVQKQDSIGTIMLNRPHYLNALNGTLLFELSEALSDLETDTEIKIIIFTGTGEKAFSAGADIHEMVRNQKISHEKEAGVPDLGQVWWRIASCKKPTIGAINGLAYGGGALLSSTFDIRIGCERTNFRFLAVKYGLINSTWSLPLIVGWPMAKELFFTGRIVEADEALRIGLLNKLVPASELMESAMSMAKTIAQNDTAAVQLLKEIMISDIGLSWNEMLQNETGKIQQSLRTPPPDVRFREFLKRDRSRSELEEQE